MAANYKVNKDKCISCGACISSCGDGMEWDEDGKAKVKNPEQVEECGGETLCPYKAIERQE
jgi:ferredoxin